MTRIVTAAAAALIGLAGAASAMTNPAGGFEGLVTSEQAAQLDATTAAAIKSVIHSEDSAGERKAKVNALLMRAGL